VAALPSPEFPLHAARQSAIAPAAATALMVRFIMGFVVPFIVPRDSALLRRMKREMNQMA
ncbi:MAG: hypothetical protein ABI400_09505, partial [Lacisediminihabitans sp.]